jgi:hypothetical protein
MRRVLSNLSTTVSLLLCGALVVLWLRSFWGRDAIEFQHSGVRWEVASEFGRLRVGNAPQLRLDLDALANLNQQLAQDGRRRQQNPRDAAWLDLRQYLAEQQRIMRRVKTWVPGPGPLPQLQLRQFELSHWPFIVAAAVLPAAWWIARARRRRRVACGLCVECGYDLRASPDRCPECGNEVAAAAAAV